MATAISEQRAIRRESAGLTRGSQFGGQQLGDLDRIQCRALAQIVAGDEQRQAPSVRHTGVATNPADEGFVDTGGGQRRRHVNHFHARCAVKDFAGTLGRKWSSELGIDNE